MYRGNTKGADANFMYPLSRTPAQSIDKAQNTMADIGLATVEIGTKVR